MGRAAAGYAKRVDALVTLLFETFEAPGSPVAALTGRASYSRRQVHRLFRDGLQETPAALRRRLLLERAAHRLNVTGMSVTELALESGYTSLEAFTRAFARAHGVSPSHYRRLGTRHFRLPAANGIHYVPPGQKTGESDMEIVDRMLAHDTWLTRQMLERARSLPDEALDRVVLAEDPYRVTEQTLRASLHRLVWTRERWLAAFTGEEFPEISAGGIDDMIRQLDALDPKFSKFVNEIAAGHLWDETFSDETCEPAETFTYGAAVAHVLTFQAQRRATALEAMRRLGIDELGYGDPIEWERTVS